MLASKFSFLTRVARNRAVYSIFRASTPFTFNVKSRQCNTLCKPLVKAFVSDDKILTLNWQDGHDVRFHHVWLRHHCSCEACLNTTSKQRTVDIALIPGGVKPQQVKVTDSNHLDIVWEDGHQSSYQMTWLQENAYDTGFTKGTLKPGYGSIAFENEMLLWNNEIITANPPPEYDFHDLKNNDDLVEETLKNILRYGFIFVNETPLDDKSLEIICERIGGVVFDNLFGRVCTLETHFHTKPDIAYSTIPLPGHTDYVFYSEPAGINAMHIMHHDGTGGVSLLIDGFLAAKTLYKEDPEAYKILTSTVVPFQWTSDEHHLPVHGPLLELDPFTQELMRIRYNNSHFGPLVNMDLTFDEMEEFYRAVRVFSAILRRPENELWFKLSPGRVVVMDNRRTLHGRSAITGSRLLKGCFVGVDDYIGRWRKYNMKKQA